MVAGQNTARNAPSTGCWPWGEPVTERRTNSGIRRRVRILSIISLPVGLLFYGTNGAFFAILLNRPIWNSAMTPLLFIMAALLSGGALITFLVHVFQRDDDLVSYLGRIILYLLVVFLFLEVLQFFVGYQTGDSSDTDQSEPDRLRPLLVDILDCSFAAGKLPAADPAR